MSDLEYITLPCAGGRLGRDSPVVNTLVVVQATQSVVTGDPPHDDEQPQHQQ